MAIVKTYSVQTNITSGKCSPKLLTNQIKVTDYVTGFIGVNCEGDVLEIKGATLFNETLLDAMVLAHTGIPPVNWQPPSLTLSDMVHNGATLYVNTGAGYQVSFAPNVNNEILSNLHLNNKGIVYDGSDLDIMLHYQLYVTSPAGKNIQIEIDYAFVKTDGTQNAETVVTGTIVDNFSVDGKTENRLYAHTSSLIPGVLGANQLQLTIRRNGVVDTYANAFDVYALHTHKN